MGKSKQSRYLRVFQSEEFTKPADWPSSVGLAVLVENDEITQIHPFLSAEDIMDMLVRIGPHIDRKYTKTPVVPKVNGVRTQSVPFSKHLEILRQLERKISENPDMLTEAENFEINFRYAMESGISYEALLAGNSKCENDGTDEDGEVDDLLSGMMPNEVEDLRLPHNAFAGAKIYFDEAGSATHLVTASGDILNIGLNSFYVAQKNAELEGLKPFDPNEETMVLDHTFEAGREKSGPLPHKMRNIVIFGLATVCLTALSYMTFGGHHNAENPDAISTLRQEMFNK